VAAAAPALFTNASGWTARGDDRGTVQALPRGARRREHPPADRFDHRQSERHRAESDADHRESATDRAGDRCASDPGRSAPQQCLAHANAIFRHAASGSREFEGSIAASNRRTDPADVARSGHAGLPTDGDQPLSVCPAAGNQEVPLADFAKLFSPNGVMDKFFTQYLAPYADTSRSDWVWRKESPVAGRSSPDTLKQFQNAAYIRDAFFQTGGGVPAVSFAIRPPGAAGPGVTVRTEIGGTTITSPTTPGPAASSLFGGPQPAPPPQPQSQRTDDRPMAGSIAADCNFSQQRHRPAIRCLSASVLGRCSGCWRRARWWRRLKPPARLSSSRGASSTIRFRPDRCAIPLNLSVLREFRCPTGIMTMRCGLFGKIGAKRDFIAIATPRSFLEAWGAVCAGCAVGKSPPAWLRLAAGFPDRGRFGDSGSAPRSAAPRWQVRSCPRSTGWGGYYPLTLHAVTGEGASLPPPNIDPQDEWFGQAETFLLSTLDRTATFEQISDALDRLAGAATAGGRRRRPCRSRRWQQRRWGFSRRSTHSPGRLPHFAPPTHRSTPRPASGGPPEAKAFRQWRCVAADCRIRFTIPRC